MSETPSIAPLFSAGEIAARVARLGRDITAHYAALDAAPVVIGVMTGGMIFCADLVRAIDRPLQLDVLHARSYRGASTSPGELSLSAGMLPELAGRHVLIVDDIFDTGATLQRISGELSSRDVASLESVVLLNKSVPRAGEVTVTPTWVGFGIEDHFVVGYGLDFDGQHRGLPHIGILTRPNESHAT